MSDVWKKYLKGLGVFLLAGIGAHWGQIFAHGAFDWRLTLATAGAMFWAYISNPNNPLPQTPPWDGLERRAQPPATPPKL